MIRRLASFVMLLPLLALISACAAGSPTIASDPTPTTPPTDVASPTTAPSPTRAATPSVSATATAISSPPPGRPTAPAEEEEDQPTSEVVVSTARPEPLPDAGTGLSQIHVYGDSGRMEVALTFDAGADRGYGEAILDTLADYEVKASFGITGHWADENPELVARMADEGHMIFNHTWSHRSWTGLSTSDWDTGVLTSDERRQELADTEQIIREVTGGYETAPYYRPPYGDYDDGVLTELAANGYYLTVMWTCDSLGWAGATVDEIVERCAANASAGDIILLHVGGKSLDAEALPAMIETLQAQGFDLVTVEELLQPAE